MCKVLAIAGVKKEYHDKVKKLARAAAQEFASTDGDGFGYAAITESGEIYGEKWLQKDDVMVLHKNPGKAKSIKMLESILDKAVKMPELSNEIVYEHFGANMTTDVLDNTRAFMFHARKKTTGEKCIQNTHPFFAPDDGKIEPTALIHNGSIQNHDKLTKVYSTCDSETILHEYIKAGINYIPSQIDQLSQTLIGEYTSIVLSKFLNDEGKYVPYMDIFKSNKDLVVGYVKELDNLVYCTNKWALESICKACSFTVENICEISDGFLIRLSAVTGERIEPLVSFQKSKEREYGIGNYNRGTYENPQNQPASLPAPRTNTHTTLGKLKRDFETGHPEVFSSDFMTVTPMTEKDIELLNKFEKENKNFHLRALALVKNSIAMRA